MAHRIEVTTQDHLPDPRGRALVSNAKEELGIEIGFTIQALAAPRTGKHQRPKGLWLCRVGLAVALEQGVEIIRRGVGIAQVELDALARAHPIADRDRPTFGIDAN